MPKFCAEAVQFRKKVLKIILLFVFFTFVDIGITIPPGNPYIKCCYTYGGAFCFAIMAKNMNKRKIF